MPIYEYRCEKCGHVMEVWAKISDPPPAECDTCSAPAPQKMVSRTSFQLKGGGWYAHGYGAGSKTGSAASGSASSSGSGSSSSSGGGSSSSGGGDSSSSGGGSSPSGGGSSAPSASSSAS